MLRVSHLRSLSMITSTGSLNRATCPPAPPLAGASPLDGSSDILAVIYNALYDLNQSILCLQRNLLLMSSQGLQRQEMSMTATLFVDNRLYRREIFCYYYLLCQQRCRLHRGAFRRHSLRTCLAVAAVTSDLRKRPCSMLRAALLLGFNRST